MIPDHALRFNNRRSASYLKTLSEECDAQMRKGM